MTDGEKKKRTTNNLILGKKLIIKNLYNWSIIEVLKRISSLVSKQEAALCGGINL